MNIDTLGGRKTIALAVVVLSSIGLVVWKGDVPGNFLNLLEWAFGIYVAGNGIEHISGTVSDCMGGQSPNPITPPPFVNIEPLIAAVTELKTIVTTLAQADKDLNIAIGTSVNNVQTMLQAIITKYQMDK